MRVGGVTRETVAHGPTRTKHGPARTGIRRPTTEGERGHVQSAIRGAERLSGIAERQLRHPESRKTRLPELALGDPRAPAKPIAVGSFRGRRGLRVPVWRAYQASSDAGLGGSLARPQARQTTSPSPRVTSGPPHEPDMHRPEQDVAEGQGKPSSRQISQSTEKLSSNIAFISFPGARDWRREPMPRIPP